MATLTYPGVYVQEVSSGVRPIAAASTSTPAFVGLAEMGTDQEARRITNWTEYQRYYGTFIEDGYLAHSVFQFFNNGGQQCYVIRVIADNAKKASVTVKNRADETGPKFTARSTGTWGNSLCLQFEDASDDPERDFKISVRRQTDPPLLPADLLNTPPLEVFDNLSMDPKAPNYVVEELKFGSYLLDAEPTQEADTDDYALRRPAKADNVRVGDDMGGEPVVEAEPGGDGNVKDNDYAAQFTLLDNIVDASLLAVPGVGKTGMMDEGMAYCERRNLSDMFYIGEMGQDAKSVKEAQDFRHNLTKPNSYGALYWPWIKAQDPTGKSREPILLPPSGYMAGQYARIDARRGVWKAPAGTEANLSGAVGLAVDLTDVQQGNLNRINVNCIRRFPASGIVAWGARTVTSDPEWTYVPVRRMAIMLRKSIYEGIQWAVFEPNDTELWSQLRLNIRSFMTTLFRQGAFQGSTPSQAFFVKCDDETTTDDDIGLGIVNIWVGFAPLKPAEFVVVQISQKAGQTS